MNFGLIDTHCHLDIIEKEGLAIEETLTLSRDSGVQKIVQIGINHSTSVFARELSEKTNPIDIHFTVGCHPADQISEVEQSQIDSEIDKSQNNPGFVGIGEIGLDYFHGANSREDQRKVFEKYLSRSIEISAPVVIHSRDAAEDTVSILSSFPRAFGVMHCFTYDYTLAKKFVDLGYYISFSGIVTFKSAKDIMEAAEKLPLESILIETDAPFLAPAPFRGKRNDPTKLKHIFEKLVELRSESDERIAEQLLLNSNNFIKKIGLAHA